MLMHILLIPFFFLIVNFFEEKLPIVIFLYLPFISFNQIIVLRIKENRDRYSSLLPVSRFNIGLSRMLVVLIPVTASYILFFILLYFNNFYNVIDQSMYIFVLFLPGVIIPVFYIFRDVFSKSLGKDSKKAIMILILGGTAFMFLGILVMGNIRSPLVAKILDLTIGNLIENNPVNAEYFEIKYFTAILLLSATSIFTFAKRKSFLK